MISMEIDVAFLLLCVFSICLSQMKSILCLIAECRSKNLRPSQNVYEAKSIEFKGKKNGFKKENGIKLRSKQNRNVDIQSDF